MMIKIKFLILAKSSKKFSVVLQVISSKENSDNNNKNKFNIFFDKDKLHNLFYSRGILYSEINNKVFIYLYSLKMK